MTGNAPPPFCVRCGHERHEHDDAGCTVQHEEQDIYRSLTVCPCPGYEAPAKDAYPRVEGKLRYLTSVESDLVEALRKDPSQWWHLAGLGDGQITVRHPITERLNGDLFTCLALESAYDNLGDIDDREGRYRWEEDGTWRRLER